MAGLSTEQINIRPDPASWSIAQCIDHLNKTNALYADAVAVGLERARARGWKATGAQRLGWLESWFVRSLEPPVKRRFRAPKAFAPATESHEKDELLARWVATHQRMINLEEESAGLDLLRVKIPSPAVRFLKFTVLSVFFSMPAHDRRHLWQASQVRNRIG